MEIQTKHRKSAEQNRPKGRALFALAERKEAPFAAMMAALTLALAAYVKTAFGATPQADDQGNQQQGRSDTQDAAVARQPNLGPEGPLVDFAETEEDRPVITGKMEDEGDLGRVGRGPGMLDLSRFFAEADPDLDMPHAYLADQPEIETAAFSPLSRGGAGLTFGTPNGMGGGSMAGGSAGPGSTPGGSQGGGSTGGGSTTPDTDADGIVGVNFHALFAQVASVIRPFHPTTVREISDLAIGDWVSQHEMYRLRGGETRPNLDAAYLAREERTYDIVTNPVSREAFVDQYFPTSGAANSTLPEATLAEDVTAAAMQPEPLLSTDTNTGLL